MLGEIRNHSNEILSVLVVVLISLGVLAAFLIRLNFLNSVLNKTNRMLHDAVEQKELLMKEMNHRIKNNLIILSGLCSMQLDSETDAKVINSLNDIIHRIDVLSLIHENLSELPDIKAISLSSIFSDASYPAE